MRKTHHLSLSIEGVLTNWPKTKLKKLFTDENGKYLSADEAKHYLIQCLKEGKELLSFGNCPDFDHIKGCPGHEVTGTHSNVMKELESNQDT